MPPEIEMRMIDDISQVPEKDITMSNLQFQSVTAKTKVAGRGTDRETSYRMGVCCPLGDVQEDVWCELMEKAARKELGDALVDTVKAAVIAKRGEDYPAQRIVKDAMEALSLLYYKDPNWAYYKEFLELEAKA